MATKLLVVVSIVLTLVSLMLVTMGHDQRPQGLDQIPVLIDSEQLVQMEITLRTLVLKLTEDCKDLNSYLRNTPESLNWISGKAARTLLALAINLDEVFGREILELLLKQ